MYKGYARIYLLASEIVAYTDNKIDDETLKMSLIAYQRQKKLTMEEIWNLWIFIEIAIIENIRVICEKIYLAQIQKYKVESIIERLVEKKIKEEQKFKAIPKNKFEISYKEMRYSFIEYMSYKLKKYGKHAIPYMNILEEQVNKMGISIADAIKKEHFDIAMQKVLIGNSITSIRQINRINFIELFGEINGVEEILRQDPAKIYEKMDYKTKSYYRNRIKEISKKTKTSERYIAKQVLKLAKEHENEESKKSHIGYYLIDKGINELYKILNIKKKIKENSYSYIYSVYIITTILAICFGIYLYRRTMSVFISILFSILSFIPISEIYIQTLNYILLKIKKPKLIPKLDLSNGIPEEYSTMVVIPTIVNNKEKVKEIIRKLEIYYLANKSENLYFTLLRRLYIIAK